MEIKEFLKTLESEYYVGVPDSKLKALCHYLNDAYEPKSSQHTIAPNEGTAVALAAGYYLATGKIPVIYMQNSGIGNALNPLVSLTNENIYGIPCILVIGWRGEPNLSDEPQHLFQGKITLPLLDILDIKYFIVNEMTKVSELTEKMKIFKNQLDTGKQVAIVIANGGLNYDNKVNYVNSYNLVRETVIKEVVEISKDQILVSTTGKSSRELFEVRKQRFDSHGNDFLTVGSMGHTSSIALSIALEKPREKVWVIDGDGALLMHMGSLALIGTKKPKNLIHVLIDNSSHESVGGMPTISNSLDFEKIVLGCGYERYFKVTNFNELLTALTFARSNDVLTFIEVKCAIGSRKNLGRPSTTPLDNKRLLMKRLDSLN